MHCHCGTNNRAPRWTFTDPCKPEVRPGAREESASPAWLAAPAMNARDTKVIYWGLTLDVDRHYVGSVTATTHQEKGIITLESNPSRGTVLPAPHGKGNKLVNPGVLYRILDKNAICQQRWKVTTQERKVCGVEIEIIFKLCVVNGSVKLTIPPNRQK